MSLQLTALLAKMVMMRASDCYITEGAAPMLRVDGNLHPAAEVLTVDVVNELIRQAMNPELLSRFYAEREANFALVNEQGRFRVSAFWQRDLPGMVIRRIEQDIPSVAKLGLPGVVQDLSIAKRGLVLIVGATGAGKSTSMAAMVDFRNQHRSGHIITIEDPIEYIHTHKQCIITQREVGIDTQSYEIALKNSLRQAPDMIMIGEIRTRETMEYAMQFAETGHLCIATLHANNANQALERILHLIPKERREQFLFDLSLNLRGILAQQLIPDITGVGRHAAFEVLINTSNVADLIRRSQLHELKECVRKSKMAGMCTFDQSLFALYQAGKISEQDALHHADSANEVKLMIKLETNLDPLNLSGVTIEE